METKLKVRHEGRYLISASVKALAVLELTLRLHNAPWFNDDA